VSNGIHAEVVIRDTRTCQVAPHSTADGKTITSIARSPDPDDEDRVIEEFTSTVERPVEVDGGVAADHSEILFRTDQKEIRRFTREARQNCVCERIESHGCPVRDVEAVDGALHVTFVTPDHGSLQSVLEELTNVYRRMQVSRLLQSEECGGTQQWRVLDLGALTERQQEVLATAHRMGYFEHPREASADDVATELGIATSTFSEHLAAAQGNLLGELLDG
jgi:predicted DNA binding protein